MIMKYRAFFSTVSQGFVMDFCTISEVLYGQKVAAVSAHWPMELSKMSSSKPCDKAEKTLCIISEQPLVFKTRWSGSDPQPAFR